MKKALITGITGQDGSYLAEFLLKKNYEVHGLRRYSSTQNKLKNLQDIVNNKNLVKNFYLHYGDITDTDSIYRIIQETKPDEIYNLAAQSHVLSSFQVPEYTTQVDAVSQLRVIEVVKQINDKIKIYQAATSELFGNSNKKFQNEKTLFNPVSPYSVAKLYGFYISKVYRKAYKLFICNGILFNHESPRRGSSFVSKKIVESIKKIINGEITHFTLGNINSIRDWGYAKEYVETMWLMLQQKKPDDYVVATGQGHSVREFVEEAFRYVNIKIRWKGKGLNEVGYNAKTKKILIKLDPYYLRPNELAYLRGDCSKLKKILKWEPKTSFKDLVKLMMQSELKS
jgi:GDPmannose 4,6-dehydratase